jgi:hypothetical protein
MGEQEPETENLSTCQQMLEPRMNITDWFGKHIEDGVSNNLRINIDDVAALRETPDAVIGQ